MLNSVESQKTKMYNAVDKVLKNSIYDSIEGILSLIYILRAFKEGHHLTIISRNENNIFSDSDRVIRLCHPEFESSFLNKIRTSISEDYFIGIYAKTGDKFYQELLKNFDFNSIKEIYPFGIEYIIQKMILKNGRTIGLTTTPNELADLLANLITYYDCKRIYNPFAGLGTIAIQNTVSECQFECQEIMPLIALLAEIRFEAHNRKASIEIADSFELWKGDSEKFDAIVSELPFGLDISTRSHNLGMARRSEEFPFYSALQLTRTVNFGIYVLPLSVCYRTLSSDMRTTALIANIIDMVIELPANLHATHGVDTCIVVFNFNKSDNKVRLINASDCFISENRSRRIDTETIMNIIKQETLSPSPLYKEIETHILLSDDANIVPSRYAYNMPMLEDNDKYVMLSDIISYVQCERNQNIEKGIIIKAQDLYSDIVDIQLASPKNDREIIDYPERYKLIQKPCIITTPSFSSFYWKRDSQPVFMPNSYFAFYPSNENLVTIPYLIYSILQAIKRMGKTGIAIGNRMLQLNLRIILPSKERQEEIINKLMEERYSSWEVKRKKLMKMSSLSDSSSNLLHELGLTFTKISAGIALLENEDKTVTDSLSANVRFALRMINSAGADFKDYVPSIEIVSVVDVINQYLNEWEAFGYKSFAISNLKTNIPSNLKVEVDIELLYTAIDCILTNAHQHGFNKKWKDDNKVTIELKAITIDLDSSKQYMMLSIGNNGVPFRDLTVEKFTERGYTGVNCNNNGLGGDHILKIMHLFGGYTSIDKAEEWSFVNLILPIYVLHENIELEAYEGNCL